MTDGALKSRECCDEAVSLLQTCRDAFEQASEACKRANDALDALDSSMSLEELTNLASIAEEARAEVSHYTSMAKDAEAKAKLAEENTIFYEESTRTMATELEELDVKALADDKTQRESQLAAEDAAECHRCLAVIKEYERVAIEASRAAEVIAVMNHTPQVSEEAKKAVKFASMVTMEYKKAEKLCKLADEYAASVAKLVNVCMAATELEEAMEASDEAERARILTSDQLSEVKACLEAANVAKESAIFAEEAGKSSLYLILLSCNQHNMFLTDLMFR